MILLIELVLTIGNIDGALVRGAGKFSFGNMRRLWTRFARTTSFRRSSQGVVIYQVDVLDNVATGYTIVSGGFFCQVVVIEIISRTTNGVIRPIIVPGLHLFNINSVDVGYIEVGSAIESQNELIGFEYTALRIGAHTGIYSQQYIYTAYAHAIVDQAGTLEVNQPVIFPIGIGTAFGDVDGPGRNWR